MAIMITYYHLKQNKLGRSLQWTSAKHCNECTEHWVGLCHEGPALLATTFPSFAIINIFATKVFTLHWLWLELTISEFIVIPTETPFESLYCVKVVKKSCQRCAPILQIFKIKTCDMFIIRAWNGIRMENSKFYIQPWILNIQIHSLLNDHFNIT